MHPPENKQHLDGVPIFELDIGTVHTETCNNPFIITSIAAVSQTVPHTGEDSIVMRQLGTKWEICITACSKPQLITCVDTLGEALRSLVGYLVWKADGFTELMHLVGHNIAAFDLPSLLYAFAEEGITVPNFLFLDTLALSYFSWALKAGSQHLKAGSHKLQHIFGDMFSKGFYIAHDSYNNACMSLMCVCGMGTNFLAKHARPRIFKAECLDNVDVTPAVMHFCVAMATTLEAYSSRFLAPCVAALKNQITGKPIKPVVKQFRHVQSQGLHWSISLGLHWSVNLVG